MKIKQGFMLREVAGSFVVVNISGELSFNGMITLNDTGAFIWKKLEQGISQQDIAASLAAEYDVEPEIADRDVDIFLKKMAGAGILE